MEGPAQVSQQAEAVVEPARAADEGEGARLPDMTYTEQETELRSAVRSVLEDRADFNAVLARTETADTYDTGLWRLLAAEVGCAGLLIPESLGGADASFREAAVVAEEVGRAVAPVPYLGSAVVATLALLSVLPAGERGSASARARLRLPAGRGDEAVGAARLGQARLGVDARLCQAAVSVRASGRLVPGRQAPAG